MRTRFVLRNYWISLGRKGILLHATREEAVSEAETMLNVYADFAENWMAIPVIREPRARLNVLPAPLKLTRSKPWCRMERPCKPEHLIFSERTLQKHLMLNFWTGKTSLSMCGPPHGVVSTRLMGALVMSLRMTTDLCCLQSGTYPGCHCTGFQNQRTTQPDLGKGFPLKKHWSKRDICKIWRTAILINRLEIFRIRI